MYVRTWKCQAGRHGAVRNKVILRISRHALCVALRTWWDVIVREGRETDSLTYQRVTCVRTLFAHTAMRIAWRGRLWAWKKWKSRVSVELDRAAQAQTSQLERHNNFPTKNNFP